jgi:hypothetical protein
MAKWSRKYKNRLEDSAFLYIEPGGRIDETGRTKPRSLRHLPVRNHVGNVDLPHVHNALGRLGQARTSIPAAARKDARAKAHRLLAREHILRAVDLEMLKPALRRRAA